MKHLPTTLFTLTLCAAAARAQETAFTIDGTTGARLGAALAFVGDVDGDGHDDFAAGEAGYSGTAGRVRLYSGRDRVALWERHGTSAEEYGYALAAAGDVNHDGKGDVIVGVPGGWHAGYRTGRVLVLSGSNGALMRELHGSTPGGRFGHSVARSAQSDADAVPDVVVGAPHELALTSEGFPLQDAGTVYVYSGSNGQPIASRAGSQPGERFGSAVAGAGDVDGDTFSDVLVGAPGHGTGQGRALLLDGNDLDTIHVWESFSDYASLGVSVCALGDADGDGREDFAFGLPGNSILGPESGRAMVVSGASWATLHLWLGEAGSQFGASLAAPGDVDGDGRADVLVGAPLGAPTLIGRFGRASLYSGATGALLGMFVGPSTGSRFGHAVAGGGDLDRDGAGDLLAGAPDDDAAAADGAGSVRLVLMAHSAGVGFCHGDGTAGACPCGNASAAAQSAGCRHSSGQGATLRGTGSARIGGDTVQLQASSMTGSHCLYFQGTTRANGGLGLPFGDGLRCAGGELTRLAARALVFGGSVFPGSVGATLSELGGAQAGETLHYQVWYRDTSATWCPTGGLTNDTNGLSIAWTP